MPSRHASPAQNRHELVFVGQTPRKASWQIPFNCRTHPKPSRHEAVQETVVHNRWHRDRQEPLSLPTRNSIENWQTAGTTTTIQCPIIRSARTATGARCCAPSAKRRLITDCCHSCSSNRSRQDMEASLPGVRACRQLLVVIPASLEEHPRIVDLRRDGETLPRLRRLHRFPIATHTGSAIRDANSSGR